MTNAVILSAGQGKRLLPLTASRPKCMLAVAGKTILQWQLDSLCKANIERIFIVTGFNSDLVEESVPGQYRDCQSRIHIVFNPFYRVCDNLASCWLARHAMEEDFLLINGDTLFETALLEHVLKSPTAPITLTVDQKEHYDGDDMKVELAGSRVKSVSKALTESQTQAESIGLLYFRENGPALFRQQLHKQIKQDDALTRWFLSVIDALARQSFVHACSINGHRWCEIDFIHDLKIAERLFSK